MVSAPELCVLSDVDSVYSSDSDTSMSQDFDSLDACLNDKLSSTFIQCHDSKRRRIGHAKSDLRPMTFVRFNTSLGKPKPVTVRALLDSGASESLINAKFTKKLRKKKTASSTVWSTPGGDLTTSSKVKAQFTMPELQEKQLIEWPLHVAKNMGA